MDMNEHQRVGGGLSVGVSSASYLQQQQQQQQQQHPQDHHHHNLQRLYHSDRRPPDTSANNANPRGKTSTTPPQSGMTSSPAVPFPDRERFRDFRNPNANALYSEDADRAGINGTATASLADFQRATNNPLLSRSDDHDDDDDDDDDDDGDDADADMDGMVPLGNNNNGGSNNEMEVYQKQNNNNSNSSGGVMKQGSGGPGGHHHPSLAMFLSPPFLNSFSQGNPGLIEGTANGGPGGGGGGVAFFNGSGSNSNKDRVSGSSSGIQDADNDNYYTQLLQSTSSLAQQQQHKDSDIDDGGLERRNSDGSDPCLSTILSCPITGALMDDASILLSCGHSFGNVGLQHCLDMRNCATCGHQVTSDSIAPNHSLRAAVQAFRREGEFHSMSLKSAKRRRDKFEQEKTSYSDSITMESSRGKGVQFPFVVNDRVVIKGNKRTPERFVGREAVITTQCLNGWYVVKTLDNAESVKLQYRSLEKVGDHNSSNNLSQKAIRSSWL